MIAAAGCTEVYGSGRSDWRRVATSNGFNDTYITMNKIVGE